MLRAVGGIRVWLLSAVLLPMALSSATAQSNLLSRSEPKAISDLSERFVHARMRRIAADQADRHGLRLMPLPLVVLPSQNEHILRLTAIPTLPETPVIQLPPLSVDRVRAIRKLERPVFTNRFADTDWAFLQGRSVVALDTALTVDIRARLEAHFGPPTRTLAEVDDIRAAPSEDIIQFEYWFIVNDSIPVVLIDVNGPLERGVVTMTDAALRSRMDDLRSGLLNPLFETDDRAAFVDYFFNVSTSQWYATGFDGASFFQQRIGPPIMALGRPYLDTYVKPPDVR